MSKASQVKKAKFCLALFSGKTARDSAIEAGYKDGKGIDVTALRLTRDNFVVKELERLRVRAEHRAILKREEALSILSMQARGNLGDFIAFKGKGKARTITYDFIHAADKLHLLQEIQITEATEDSPQKIRIKLHDPQAAIEKIARMLGWNESEALPLPPQVIIENRPTIDNRQIVFQANPEVIKHKIALANLYYPKEDNPPDSNQNGNGIHSNGNGSTKHTNGANGTNGSH